MSLHASIATWQSSPYAGTTRVIHLALAERANAEGVCWPSYADLAERANCSLRTVERAMARLIEDGWIEVIARTRRARAGAGRASYRLIHCGQTPPTPDIHPTKCPVSTPDTGPPTPDSLSPTPDKRDTPIENRHEPTKVSGPRPEPAGVDNPWGVTAHSVTEWAWQQRIHKNLPKPLIGANPFAAARSMAQQLLDAGHRAEAIARVYAANDGAWTLQALQHLLREQPPSPSRPQPAPYRPDPTVADFGDAAAKARQLRKTLRRQVDDPPTAV